jgi:hypothetical protein
MAEHEEIRPGPEVPRSEANVPGEGHAIVHLRRADLDNPQVAAGWHARGYATLGPVEGHDPYQRCPICSTDEPDPDCAICGQGPCALTRLLRGQS